MSSFLFQKNVVSTHGGREASSSRRDTRLSTKPKPRAAVGRVTSVRPTITPRSRQKRVSHLMQGFTSRSFLVHKKNFFWARLVKTLLYITLVPRDPNRKFPVTTGHVDPPFAYQASRLRYLVLSSLQTTKLVQAFWPGIVIPANIWGGA